MTPYYDNGTCQLYHGDAREIPLADQSVHCVVTSPPYFGLRVYSDNDDRGIGLESSVESYIANLVDVFREIRRVLRDDGVLWVNLGDSMVNDPGWGRDGGSTLEGGKKTLSASNHLHGNVGVSQGNRLGIPERVVLALQADGWIWRDTVIWAKKSAMPESVNGWRWERCRVKVASATNSDHGKNSNSPDRTAVGFNDRWDGVEGAAATWQDCPGCAKCEANDGLVLRKGSWRNTSSHEVIFMLVKSMGYFCDAEAVKTFNGNGWHRGTFTNARAQERDAALPSPRLGLGLREEPPGANRRSVWNDIRPEPYGGTNCPGCGETFKSKVYRRFPNRYTCQDCEFVIVVSPNKAMNDCPQCGGDVRQERLCIRCEIPLQSHFATFPSDLPRICVQASTSDAGVCSSCGSQWARVVDRQSAYEGNRRNDSGQDYGTSHGSGWKSRVDASSQTLGFRPTCDCNAPAIPATVLDPFAGTFTTGLAAQRLGRRAVDRKSVV